MMSQSFMVADALMYYRLCQKEWQALQVRKRQFENSRDEFIIIGIKERFLRFLMLCYIIEWCERRISMHKYLAGLFLGGISALTVAGAAVQAEEVEQPVVDQSPVVTETEQTEQPVVEEELFVQEEEQEHHLRLLAHRQVQVARHLDGRHQRYRHQGTAQVRVERQH